MDDLLLASSSENAFELELPIDKWGTCPYLHGSIPLHPWVQQYTHSQLSVLSFPCINYNTNLTHSTTTQLTSHVHKFPLTHEISSGYLIFHSRHPTKALFGSSPPSPPYRWVDPPFCCVGCLLPPGPSFITSRRWTTFELHSLDEREVWILTT